MTDSGDAIMGAATAVGPDRASEAILKALDSPLLLSNDIRGTKNILLNISYGISEYEVTMDEISIITSQLEKQVGLGTQIIWGATVDEKLEDKLSVTVVATGFSLDKSSIVSKNNVANVASQPIAHAVEVPQQAPKEPININEYYGQINTANSNYKQPGYSNPQESMQQEKVVVTLDLNDDNNVDRLEAIPAYKRKNMQNIVPENDSKNLRNEISDFSIGKNGDDFCIKEQNDFLHNNVD